METLRRCDAEVVAFVDADCATPPVELLRLVEATEHADLAIATRWHPAAVVPAHRPVGRRLASAGFAWGVRHLFGLPYKDTQCGAKAMRRDAAVAIIPLLSSRDFLFDVDLLLTARSLGLRIEEVPTVWVDQAGSRLDAARDARRMALSAMRLWVHTRVLPVTDDSHPLVTGPPLVIGQPLVTGRSLAADPDGAGDIGAGEVEEPVVIDLITDQPEPVPSLEQRHAMVSGDAATPFRLAPPDIAASAADAS